jgi:hypothetical protein
MHLVGRFLLLPLLTSVPSYVDAGTSIRLSVVSGAIRGLYIGSVLPHVYQLCDILAIIRIDLVRGHSQSIKAPEWRSGGQGKRLRVAIEWMRIARPPE